MHGIPTVYKGIQFRSRTEAKWAVFFDLTKRTWLYEWTDLAGYIPDFLVDGVLLAEVKACGTLNELTEHVAKIEKSGWKGPWVLLGSHPSIQLGTRISIPDNAEDLWAEACNMTRWLPKGMASQAEYASAIPSFDAEQFRSKVPLALEPPTAPRPTLPELVTYRLPMSPKSEPTPPRLPV